MRTSMETAGTDGEWGRHKRIGGRRTELQVKVYRRAVLQCEAGHADRLAAVATRVQHAAHCHWRRGPEVDIAVQLRGGRHPHWTGSDARCAVIHRHCTRTGQ